MQAGAIESRTQEIGNRLLDAAEAYRPGPAERMQDWLLTHAVADDRFRGRLLRYMDVLAALDYDESGHQAKRLANEYFSGGFPDLPFALRWLFRLARNEAVPARVVGQSARRSAELFARRFITRPGIETVSATTAFLANQGRYPSFDLLGEAVLSEREADQYGGRYLSLIDQLGQDPAAGTRTAGDIAALQVSLKLSSLTAQFTPLDPRGTVARLRPALERIAERARAVGVGITIDLEQYEYRDLTWRVFTETFAPGERLGDWPDIGIVLQAYLREADSQAAEMVNFARARGTPFQVRLVKGAYWDYETITAAANRWRPPVFTEKRATDAQFERVLELLVPASPELRLAVGSHNPRAHACGEALAEAVGLPPGAIEHQTLMRTAEGTSRALTQLGWMARDYVPVGELLPGMAYLVRRVLENSSQAGFLLQSRRGVPRTELLKRPPGRRSPPERPDEPTRAGVFSRTPGARWFDPVFRLTFEEALDATRVEQRRHLTLEAAGRRLPATEELIIHSPSDPGGEPLGTVDLAGEAAALEAVSVARQALTDWAGRPAAERAAVLRRAARLLEERAAEFAAWVVCEGGRDREGAWGEVEEAIDALRYYAAEAERLFGEFGSKISALGVAAVLPPWNFSLAIPCGMTSGALAAGNTVVLKPAEQTPLIAHRLVALLHEAGVPPRALIFLPGRGETCGRALVGSPDVNLVAFTGSRAVGTEIYETAAQVRPTEGPIKGVVAEMGGKNPILVFADADLDEVVEATIESAFGHANQRCSAASRVLIERPVYELLRRRLADAARSLNVGPAEAPSTQVNPVIDAEAAERLRKAAARARSECEVVLDRFDLAGAGGQHQLFGPLIVELGAERATSAATATEELFGPILLLVPFEDEATAYRIANATAYGLTAGVFTRSPATIERAVRAIECGNIYVNRKTTAARVGVEPFGGVRMSGTGPQAFGPDYLWAFTRRTDAPVEDAETLAILDAASGGEDGHPPTVQPWNARLLDRIETVERASVLLGRGGRHEEAGAFLGAAQAARRELAQPGRTLPVAGQSTVLQYATARGLGLLRATGRGAGWWLAAALLGGNAVVVFDAARLAGGIAALRAAGLPDGALEVRGDLGEMIALAGGPEVSFAATDGGPEVARALQRRLGPTTTDQRSLKALLSAIGGPQPGEAGFLRRFALPKTVAIRTLRHGADLALEFEGTDSIPPDNAPDRRPLPPRR